MLNFEIRKSKENEIDAIIQLLHEVWAVLPRKDWFVVDHAAYTRAILTDGTGTGYLALDPENGQLAGAFITVIPGSTSPENLGLDVGLPAAQLSLVVHMDSVAVRPAYRGYHLQRQLMLTAESDLKHAGFRYLCCTIHPENKYSLQSALALGYQVKTHCPKYGGYPRAILMKEI